MNTSTPSLPGDGKVDKSEPKNQVIDLNRARARRRKRGQVVSPEAIGKELDDVRLLLDQGLSSAAEEQLTSLLDVAGEDVNLLARTRLALSLALEMQGRFREAFDALALYEEPEARAGLDTTIAIQVRVQIGICYNGNGDHPKAIAVLNAALREAEEFHGDTEAGWVYVALARVYRNINEFTIARDYSQKALEHNRSTGDWRGLAETYCGLGRADTYEGNYESALENFEQALKLVGDRPAPYLLGTIYADMAGAYWFLKRPQDGIACLEKSISYYERTEHKANAARAYNNLALNLVLSGEWDRAHAMSQKAVELAFEIDGKASWVAITLDTLGELLLLRGELDEAQATLERALSLAQEKDNKWYATQVIRTLGRCYLAQGDMEKSRRIAEEALELAQRIGDRQAISQSHLLLAETHLGCGELAETEAVLHLVSDETEESTIDLAVTGDAQRLRGMLALAQNNIPLATHHFSRSLSIFETLGDRYRSALAHYKLGRAFATTQPERAAEHLTLAVSTFQRLGAKLALSRAEESLAALDRNAPEQAPESSVLTQLLTLRLAEAVASRELLLAELAAVIHQETNAERVVVMEPDSDGASRLVISYGASAADGTKLIKQFDEAADEKARKRFLHTHDVSLIALRSPNSAPATVLISPPDAAFPAGVSIQPLLRVVELGMDVCALRDKDRAGRGNSEQTAYVDQSLLPGFIHSSPAMTRLVEEVHKIRSSDVTVLVTGESGTGKELVSRAIHALSSRRNKVFVPFNCTAVPKELSEGYLFGYRRGAFTGAVNDSAGVIRAAAGGTLFLDEIGDLPLDLQPKLLRFLQEGEIQPLGEQKPIKVDVRIIAATNTALEEMVADGRFREDLYYRLNVIRLQVPPLRERRSEIPTIVNYYINHYSAKFGRRDIQLTPQTIDLLMVCEWPGNVRQLCNEVQRIVARAEDGTIITPDDLSADLKRISMPITAPASASVSAIHGGPVVEGTSLAEAMEVLERQMITDALRRHNGNVSRAARELGLTRRGLYLKLERYQLSASA
jgi:transcriptional regulator with PAS, ATPase and Fis domain/Tfp pilus assembly protein PilF